MAKTPKTKIQILYVPRTGRPAKKPITAEVDDNNLIELKHGSYELTPGSTWESMGKTWALVLQDWPATINPKAGAGRHIPNPNFMNEVAGNNYTQNVLRFARAQKVRDALNWLVLGGLGFIVLLQFYTTGDIGDQLDQVMIRLAEHTGETQPAQETGSGSGHGRIGN